MSDTKKVLVTGGAGYIGSHTSVVLAEAGYEVLLVDDFSRSPLGMMQTLSQIMPKETLRCFNVDCIDSKSMGIIFKNEGPIYAVIHFAAYKSIPESVFRPLLYHTNNTGALANILSLMDEYHVHNLVYSSSCAIYGDSPVVPVTESAIQVAMNPYAHTKIIGEQLIKDCVVATYDIRSVSLRYFNPIGAHPSKGMGEPVTGHNIVPTLIRTARQIQDVFTIYGNDFDTQDGYAVRDYIHVMDLAEAHVKSLDWLEGCVDKPFAEAFNLGSGIGHSVKEVVNEFVRQTGCEISLDVVQRRSGEIGQIWADPSKANRELKWRATRSIGLGLKSAYKHHMLE